MTVNHCGSCTMCCKALGVQELHKPAAQWCQHCKIGTGCKIYEARPPSCREFACLWLQSQERADPSERMAPGLRPDRCKVVIAASTNDLFLQALVDPGQRDAWRKPELYRTLCTLALAFRICIGWGPSRDKLLLTNGPEGVKVQAITMSEPDAEGFQWGKAI